MHEPPGFRRFVEARYSSLVRFGVVLCGDAGRGEELTQVALVKTLHAWSRLGVGLGDPEGHTRAVMAQLAWRGEHRRRVGKPATVVPAALDGVAPADTGGVQAVEEGEALRRVLATLPAQQRVVLVLRFLTHLREGEIAAELRCTTGTVRNRLGRALAVLRGRGLLDEAVGGELR